MNGDAMDDPGQKFPTAVASWRHAWSYAVPFFAFPPAVRRVVYATSSIESVHARLRKIIKTRGHFPCDDAATRLIWLALCDITADWSRAAHDWKPAMNQFAILYAERFSIRGEMKPTFPPRRTLLLCIRSISSVLWTVIR